MNVKRIITIVAAMLFAAALSTVAYAGPTGPGANAQYTNAWHADADGWRYYTSGGRYYHDGWEWVDGNQDGISECYFFQSNGLIITNGRTPDGYQVNADGAWVENGVVQTKRGNGQQGGAQQGGAQQASKQSSESQIGNQIAVYNGNYTSNVIIRYGTPCRLGAPVRLQLIDGRAAITYSDGDVEVFHFTQPDKFDETMKRWRSEEDYGMYMFTVSKYTDTGVPYFTIGNVVNAYLFDL